MPRTARNAKVDSRSARAKLAKRAEPYWTPIAKGRALGYRKGAKGGSWIARYRDDAGRQHYQSLGAADDLIDGDGATVLSFSQAQEHARDWFAERARAEGGDQGGPYSVKQAVLDYLDEMEARGAKSARDARTRAEAQIIPQLGGIEVKRLTAAKLKAWHRDLAKAPARLRTKPGEPQQYRDQDDDPETARRRKATANRVLAILRASLNHAWREGKVQSDDAWRRVKPFEETDAARARYLSTDEITRLVNACDPGFRELVQGALFTGCRYGELTRMRVADFNQDAGTVAVRSSKSGKPRHVVLTAEGSEFLAAQTAGRDGDAPIFPRQDGEPWAQWQQRRPMIQACERARVSPAAGFHVLRHTYASHCVMAGIPLMVVAKNLGHSDTRMVERHYGHLSRSYVANAIRGCGLGYDVPRADANANVEQLRPAKAGS
jgi:integrase